MAWFLFSFIAIYIALIAIICFITSLSGIFGASLLKDIKVEGDDTNKEITLAIEGSYYYKYFELSDPDRLVVDLYDVEIKSKKTRK